MGHQNQNITRVVEQVLNRFVFNVSFANQPFFVSAFPDYIEQAKMLWAWKIPKSLTMFFGENGESTVERITRYTIEVGEVVSNEYLKMRFFPSSLTKNALFSNLRPNSITTWAQLEASFNN